MLPKLSDLQSWLTTELGSLKPYQIEQLINALARHGYEHGTPVNGFSGQPTLSTIISTWSAV